MKKVGILLLLMILILSSCSEKQSSDNTRPINKKDNIVIYDADGNKLREVTEQSELDYFSNLIGNSTENIDEENADTLLEKVPEDAQISYRYVFISTRESDGVSNQFDFVVYKNYPYITLDGIPFLSTLTWELSEEDNNKLQHPMDLK